MEFEESKNILKKALIESFVDDYKSYKKTIEFINNDLDKSNIKYQYSYDTFCAEFLSETLINLKDVDIFTVNEYNNFFINFWQFNLYNLQSMLNKKLNELGYKYEDFYENSNIKKKVNKRYFNSD
jgi:hypothetical protein